MLVAVLMFYCFVFATTQFSVWLLFGEKSTFSATIFENQMRNNVKTLLYANRTMFTSRNVCQIRFSWSIIILTSAYYTVYFVEYKKKYLDIMLYTNTLLG